MAEMIEIEILRYRPEQDNEPWMQTFQVPYQREMSLLDALQYIKDHLDSTLSFRWSCRMAICGSCGMMVNGVPKLGCKAFLRDYLPGKMTVEPLNNFPIERDLVVDMSDFIEKLESIKPYIIPSEPRSLCDGEYIQTPAQMAQYKQFSPSASTVVSATRPARSTASTRSSPVRRHWLWPIATTSTTVMPAPKSVCVSSARTKASGAVPSWATAPKCARKASIRQRPSSLARSKAPRTT